MRKRMLLVFTLGMVGGWLTFGGGSQAIAQAVHGLWNSHVLQETYRISIGVDSSGKARPDRKVDEVRTHYNLPMHYGNLIGVTGHDGAAVFWYQDAQGVIRNAIVPNAATELSRVEYTSTRRFETDVLP